MLRYSHARINCTSAEAMFYSCSRFHNEMLPVVPTLTTLLFLRVSSALCWQKGVMSIALVCLRYM